ncbi:hypothetical protein INT45_009035 [Circinella minor]|uniref:non-specific serine/threonine protein kinase n=1 Tax=Circinella minor TaxID=1195481 RepID=A0A8H7VL81_9FUNG|nr:hypothetical protein INT45_009035 [Circinella minor]
MGNNHSQQNRNITTERRRHSFHFDMHHHTPPKPQPIPDNVGEHYKVTERIGAGSFGVIYKGINTENNQDIAIKFECDHTRQPQLKDEYHIYEMLTGAPGFPQSYYYGHETGYNILVMDLLGPNLDELFNLCDKQFSPKTVCMIAKKMLRLLQRVHDLGLIYRDVKPDNFLIGYNKEDNKEIYMIDFGMSKPYRDPQTGCHIPFRERGCLSGTARYMSLHAHAGEEQSRRDDLESMGYVLLYLLRGSLPWQGVKASTEEKKYEKIEELKHRTPIAQLCAGVPVEFSIFLHYIRKLKFDEAPDYDFCQTLFDKGLKRIGATDDGVYDWMLLNDGKGWQSCEPKPSPLMLTY